MPTATHALWALQTMGHENEVPDLSHLFEQDFSWWSKIYTPGFDLLPIRWRIHIEEKINSDLDPMTEPYLLHKINHFEED